MANKLFIVQDEVFTKLPQRVRDKTLAEIRRLFAFIGSFQVVTSAPAQFPATFDFTDSTFRLSDNDEDIAAYVNQSVDQQQKNIIFSGNQKNTPVDFRPSTRSQVNPDTGGHGFQNKQVFTSRRIVSSTTGTTVTRTVTNTNVAFTITGGTGSLKFVLSTVLGILAGNRDKREILEDRRKKLLKQLGKKDIDIYHAKPGQVYTRGSFWDSFAPTPEFFADQEALDTWALMDQPLANWPVDKQDIIGVALGRFIAHEVRHQYIGPQHADEGVGGDGETFKLWGDRKSEQFSNADQSAILRAFNTLETDQRRATILLETNPNGQPFAF